ncbi:hypothetical protein [Marinomonas ostreistagni]|uniref:hypothetical protein n=1 Tax=Marinomonas ostreistagni TaxID=359209 RepID=UPI00195203AD|nr:hypothetical protein [Marinomonas ostreistagni]MBM6549914.1 hypothetical protein [Marinomonas ostreistagni]
MKKFTTLAVTAGLAVVMTGCSTTDSADKETFEYAINENLANDCLMLTTRDANFPVTVDVPQTDREQLISVNSTKIEQYDALVEAGLLQVQNEQREVMATLEQDAHTVSAKTYSLTDKGQQSLKAVHMQNAMGGVRKGFCVASYKVDEVLEFSEPTETMGQTVSHVHYTMTPTGIQEWGRSPAVQAAFPNVASRLEATRRENATLVLSDEGWVDETTLDERPL